MTRLQKHKVTFLLGALLMVLAAVLPSRIMAFQPERSYFGPYSYDSRVHDALEFPLFSGARSMPAVFDIEATFRVDDLPARKSSRVFSTGIDGRGLSIDVDFMGTLYLRLRSTPPDSNRMSDASQLVKASDRFDLGKTMHIALSYRRAANRMSVEVNGESKVLFETEDLDQSFDPSRILPDLSFIQIGGPQDNKLQGAVSGLRLSVSDTDDRGRTQAVSLFLAVLGMWMILSGCVQYLAIRKSRTLTSVD